MSRLEPVLQVPPGFVPLPGHGTQVARQGKSIRVRIDENIPLPLIHLQFRQAEARLFDLREIPVFRNEAADAVQFPGETVKRATDCGAVSGLVAQAHSPVQARVVERLDRAVALPYNHCRNAGAIVNQRISRCSNVLRPTDNLPDLRPDALYLQAMKLFADVPLDWHRGDIDDFHAMIEHRGRRSTLLGFEHALEAIDDVLLLSACRLGLRHIRIPDCLPVERDSGSN